MLKVRLAAPGMDKILSYLETVPEGSKVFPFSTRTARRKIHRLNPNTSPHWFRHTRATRLAERTADVFAILSWFGWKRPEMAMHYIQMTGKMSDRLSDKVD